MKGLETSHKYIIFLRSLCQFSSLNFTSCCWRTVISSLRARTRRTCTENEEKATCMLPISLLQTFSTTLLLAEPWTECCGDMPVHGRFYCTLSLDDDTGEHTIHPGGQQTCRSINKSRKVWKLCYTLTEQNLNIMRLKNALKMWQTT
jgi:hypothetical protein